MPDDSSRGSNKSSGNKSGGSANRTSSGGPSRSSGGSRSSSGGPSRSSGSANRTSSGGPSRSGGGNNTRQSSDNNNSGQANRTVSGGPSRGRDMGKSTPVANRTSSGGPNRGSNNDRMNIKNIQFLSGTTPAAKRTTANATARASATPNSRKTNPPLSMGPQVAPPKHKAFSLKGIFSKDPANVARNRAASAMYASKASDPNKRSDSAEAGGRRQYLQSMMGEMDKIDPGRNKAAADSSDKKTTAGTAATTGTKNYVAAPAGYRPGIDPEHNYFPTTKPAGKAMKNGGKVKPKGTKK